MSRDSNPTCPLLQQFAQDLKIAGLSEITQEFYCRVTRKFTEACKKRPDQATEDDVYTLGLRLQEGLFLQPRDIDSQRMLVHIHRGKGAKDRLIPPP